MVLMLTAFAVSFLMTLGVVRLSRTHAHLIHDLDVSGPQKFHARPVPRIGGVGIVGAVFAGASVLWWSDAPLGYAALTLAVCGLPAFLAGLVEDMTKQVTPRMRLAFTAISAALAVWLLESAITRTELPGLDGMVALPLGAALVTMFVVAGVANAVNIIDGFNGLASMCVVMMLAALAYVGFVVGDTLVLALALAGIGAVFGFFILNFPAGLVFLGDGGAYFLGFYVAEVAILLLHRNPQVSPMFPLLVCVYPVFETLFSIYRKRVLRGMSPGVPDGIHLHMLVYKRLMRWAVGSRDARRLTRRNSLTSLYLWGLCMFSVVPSVLWWDSTPVLVVFLLIFALTYITLYWRIVRFRAPRWLVIRRLPRGYPQAGG